MEVSHLKEGKSPKMVIQNFLKNTVISTVFDFQTTKFLACNFIFSPQIQGDC